MASVLRRELADEVRLPQRFEAVHGVEGGKAGVFGIDEHHAIIANMPMARTKLRWKTDSLPLGRTPISISCPVW
jgi:hypothetical protein